MSQKVVLTLKVDPEVLEDYNDLASLLKMNRSEMVRTAIYELAQKQKTQVA
jgi:predicted transcriptional regulator